MLVCVDGHSRAQSSIQGSDPTITHDGREYNMVLSLRDFDGIDITVVLPSKDIEALGVLMDAHKARVAVKEKEVQQGVG